MMSGIKAAIFDMDGTLVDSMPYWRGHMLNYLKEKKADIPPNLEELVNTAGSFSVILKLVQKVDPSITREKMIEDYHALMAKDYKSTIVLKPYVREYLEKLEQEAMPMAIATATPRELFIPMLQRLELESYFDFYITVPEIGIRKSEPAIYDYCALQFDLPRADCAVFEDTIQAITTASTAGFYTVGVADEVSQWVAEDIKSTADQYIESFQELL